MSIIMSILILVLAIDRFVSGQIQNFQDFIVTIYYM
jgi:hypothetical protein